MTSSRRCGHSPSPPHPGGDSRLHVLDADAARSEIGCSRRADWPTPRARRRPRPELGAEHTPGEFARAQPQVAPRARGRL